MPDSSMYHQGQPIMHHRSHSIEKAADSPDLPLTSLSLTHVQFMGNDIYAKIFAHLTLSPLAITCGYIGVVVATRDLTPLIMLIGQLLNECINFALKRCIKQSRPTDVLGDGYGMPSSHSQFMAFFATYLNLLIYRWNASPDDTVSQIISVFVILWAALVIYSRVHLNYHTWQQVVAGTLCGCAFAIGYYFFVNSFLRSTGMMEWMQDNDFGRWAFIRDVGQIDHAYRWEWEQFQQWRQTNQKS